ncbi:MAG: hypothetical protein K6F49_08680 [Saccharofermentans sp.]|nr:hypothetical protein [Saccharofermentans sp.]
MKISKIITTVLIITAVIAAIIGAILLMTDYMIIGQSLILVGSVISISLLLKRDLDRRKDSK